MAAAIDWGNSNTVVVFTTGTQGHILKAADSPEIPSYACYDSNGTLLTIGPEAKNRVGHGHVIAGVKRLIGIGYDEDEAIWARKVYGLNLRENDGRLEIQVGNVFKTPEQIATEYFRKLKEILSGQARESVSLLGKLLNHHGINEFVVTCPAHYNPDQVGALMRCLEDAGLVLWKGRLTQEPVAAGQLLTAEDRRGFTLIIDWGGGTLDYALMAPDGSCKYMSAVQKECGGIDMDWRILEGLQEEGRVPEELPDSARAFVRLTIEKLKEDLLSSKTETTRELRLRPPDMQEEITLTASRLEVIQWLRNLLNRAKNSIRNVLKDAAQSGQAVSRCVLVGGPVRSPHIADMIREAVRVPVTVAGDPMTAVARGALAIAGDDRPPDPPLAHDYGIQVDQYGVRVGSLLLRSQTPCSVAHDEREMELRGFPGQVTSISVWLRKAQSDSETVTYESSAEFQFLPRFDSDGNAKIKVALRTDPSGIVSASVTDATTNQQMNLTRVGNAISKTLSGPPCRSLSEYIGRWLLQEWHQHVWQELTGRPGRQPGGGSSDSLKEIHTAAVEVADESIRATLCMTDRDDRLKQGVERLKRKMAPPKGEISEALIQEIMRDVDSLHVIVIQSTASEVADVLGNLEAAKSDADFARKTAELCGILRSFNAGRYDRLASCCSEAKLLVMHHGISQETLGAFNLLAHIIMLHSGSAGINHRMANLRRKP